MIVDGSILAESEIDFEAASKGLKCLANLLKSLNGSSEINKALPAGHSTSLFIKMMVAAD